MIKLFTLAASLFLLLAAHAQQTDTLAQGTDLTVLCLLVQDHDEAIEYYREKLGFVVKQDVNYGEGQRWVSLTPREGSPIELSLGLARTDEERALVGKQAGGYPFFVLYTEDLMDRYESFKEAGVEFTGEPTRGPWGIGVTFQDLYGNSIYLRGK